jgi:hypothetical protein
LLLWLAKAKLADSRKGHDDEKEPPQEVEREKHITAVGHHLRDAQAEVVLPLREQNEAIRQELRQVNEMIHKTAPRDGS